VVYCRVVLAFCVVCYKGVDGVGQFFDIRGEMSESSE
jgi:hypothetical protein